MTTVERGNGAQLSVAALDGETPLTADELPVVTLTDYAGDTVGDPITAAEGAGPGEYTAQLPGQDTIGPLTATWSFTVDDNPWAIATHVDIVAGFYFDIAQVRRHPALSTNTTRYTTEDLLAARDWAEALFERHIRTSFLERFHLETAPRHLRAGRASRYIELDRTFAQTLRSCSVDDVAVDGAEIEVGGDRVYAPTWPAGTNVTTAYTAGAALSVPADLRDAGIAAAVHHLISGLGASAIPARATTVQATPGGAVAVGTAGDRKPTGLPEVDAILNAYRDEYSPAVIL